MKSGFANVLNAKECSDGEQDLVQNALMRVENRVKAHSTVYGKDRYENAKVVLLINFT